MSRNQKTGNRFYMKMPVDTWKSMMINRHKWPLHQKCRI